MLVVSKARPVGFMVAESTSITVSALGVKYTETGDVVTPALSAGITLTRTFEFTDAFFDFTVSET
jgi:hypothetical protein